MLIRLVPSGSNSRRDFRCGDLHFVASHGFERRCRAAAGAPAAEEKKEEKKEESEEEEDEVILVPKFEAAVPARRGKHSDPEILLLLTSCFMYRTWASHSLTELVKRSLV